MDNVKLKPHIEINEESGLVQHARRELALVGDDEYTTRGYLEMLTVFSHMGHSGGSASVFIPTLMQLLQHKNLMPITNDPEEWRFVSEGQWGQAGGIWQNCRNGEAFSNDEGKSYYLLSEGGSDRNRRPIHLSMEKK